MAVVVGIRVERSADRSHDHIVGVWTSEGSYRTNRQVANAIKSGEAWFSSAGGEQVPIGWIPWCNAMNCGLSPYLTTRRTLQRNVGTGIDLRIMPTSADHLENLPAHAPRPVEAAAPA